MVIKFTPTVIKFIPFGACSLVGVSAEFGTMGGMLIRYSHSLSSTLVGVLSLVGVSAEFGTLGDMLIGYSC